MNSYNYCAFNLGGEHEARRFSIQAQHYLEAKEYRISMLNLEKARL
jgi:hypothetical protein